MSRKYWRWVFLSVALTSVDAGTQKETPYLLELIKSMILLLLLIDSQKSMELRKLFCGEGRWDRLVQSSIARW